jgi:hypothetical protein
MTSSLFTVVILSLSLLACQESPPEGNWSADAGVDAADANADTRGDADPDDGGSDAKDVQDSGDEDTGPDCSKDSDGDNINNCDEAELCTSPTNADTDEDGLSDFEELEEGIDPCDPDTDDDGVDDQTELDVGLDPEDSQTFDGVSDGDLWRVDACPTPMNPLEDVTEKVNYVTRQAQNYKFGVPDDFSSVQNVGLSGVPARVAATLFSDAANSLYGFVLSKSAEEGRTEPDVSARKTVRPAVLELVGNDEDNLSFSTIGGTFTTHDDHRASIARYKVTSPTTKTAAKVREELLLGMDAFSREDITGGLPTTAGPSYMSFRIVVSVIHRTKGSGPNQVLLSAAVAPTSVYDDNPQVPSDMDDLTNTTQISEPDSSMRVGCVPAFLIGGEPFRLPDVPVSGSLSLVLEDGKNPTEAIVVPRSRENGYSYSSTFNTLGIFGTYARMAPVEGPGNFVAVRYEYFTSP